MGPAVELPDEVASAIDDSLFEAMLGHRSFQAQLSERLPDGWTCEWVTVKTGPPTVRVALRERGRRGPIRLAWEL